MRMDDCDATADVPSLYSGLIPLYVLHRVVSGAPFDQSLLDKLDRRCWSC
jgi:hypothetical protein